MKSIKYVVLGILLGFSTFATAAQKSRLPTHKTQAEDFFYAQQTSLWVFFKAPKEIIRKQIGETLDKLGFEIVTFEDPNMGYVIVKPMVFMAEFGYQDATIPGTSASTEVEFTVLVQPKKNPNKQLGTFDDFISGRTKGSSVGQLRIDVLCDHEIAVAAGRKNFGEHKFLGSFTYSYTTPNNQVGKTQPFTMDMTAYTWKGAGIPERKMFQIKAKLDGLKPAASQFSPELLYSAFPPEPQIGVTQKAVGEYRFYNNSHFRTYATFSTAGSVELSFGDVKGAEPLKPAPPFGDNKPIPGSEVWPQEMVEKMKELVSPENAVGFLLFKSPSAEYEIRPFEI
jgi:hypothetical protein